MALKCVACGLLFRSRNELDCHTSARSTCNHDSRRPRRSRRRPRLRQRTKVIGSIDRRRQAHE
jgi:hypothetical protein